MSARGVHFAVTPAQEKRLLAAKSGRKLMELVEEIEEAWEGRLSAKRIRPGMPSTGVSRMGHCCMSAASTR